MIIMKRRLIAIIIMGLCITVGAWAQRQQLLVRTLERSDKPSVGIEGVTVNVLEHPNALVSNKGGLILFTFEGKRTGDSFTISRVQKKGYSLVDKQLKGRRFAYSASVPVEIVMVADAQLEKDKKRIEDKAYDKAKKNYNQKVANLEKQLQEKTISEQEYRAKYEELNANYNNYIQLIDEMAERYATTDYKGLSDVNRQILECIENADLERADSLINTKGSFEKREQEVANKMELYEKTQSLSQQIEDDLVAELRDLIQDYYNKYTIHAAAYRNDSAAYYLERIVQLYPYDVHIIKKTANFIDNYLADYQRALKYYQLGLTQAQERYGEDDEWTGLFCERIGLTYDKLHDIEQALEWQHKALDIYEHMPEPDSASISMSYTLIGRAYISKKEYDKALEYTMKGLEMRERATEPDSACLAQSYNNLGVIYHALANNEKSLEYHMKALNMREQYYGADDTEVAFSCMNLCKLCLDMNDSEKALEYAQKALGIYQRVVGTTHPYTIYLQSFIGAFYYEEKSYNEALYHYLQALTGAEQYYGKDDDSTNSIIGTLIGIYAKMGDIEHAQQYAQRMLESTEHNYGPESTKTAEVCIQLGQYFKEENACDVALEYLQHALDILEKAPDRADHEDVIKTTKETINELKP